MFRTLCLIFTMAAVSCPGTVQVHAQEQPAEPNALHEGAWALQFGIGGNFTLTAFQGTSIAAKYHLSESNAVRAGVSLNANLRDNGSDGVSKVEGGGSGQINSLNARSVSATLSFQYLWYAAPTGVVHFYVGAGPVISFSRETQDTDDTFISTGASLSSRREQRAWRRTSWGLGAGGAVGVEWFPARWASLRAEYGDEIKYEWGRSTTDQQSTTSAPGSTPSSSANSETSKAWLFNTLGVTFGLNIYF
jgi:hypothetical protein